MPRLSVSDRLRKQLQQEIDRTYLSMREIAEKSGVDAGQISRFLNEERALGGKAIDKLCKYLKLELRSWKRNKPKD